MIVSVKEARDILGDLAKNMSDDEIAQVIDTLHVVAKDSLQLARNKIKMHNDAHDLAQLIYDIYQDKKRLEAGDK